MKLSASACFVNIICLGLAFTVIGAFGKKCGDRECKTVISTGRASMRYRGAAEGKVNVDQNEVLEILAKQIGKNEDYLVRKANGKVGILAKYFLKETQIFVTSADLVTVSDDGPSSEPKVEQTAANGGTKEVPSVPVPSNENAESISESPTKVPDGTGVPVEPAPRLEVIPHTQPSSAEGADLHTVEKSAVGTDDASENSNEDDEEEEEDDDEEEIDVDDEEPEDIDDEPIEDSKEVSGNVSANASSKVESPFASVSVEASVPAAVGTDSVMPVVITEAGGSRSNTGPDQSSIQQEQIQPTVQPVEQPESYRYSSEPLPSEEKNPENLIDSAFVMDNSTKDEAVQQLPEADNLHTTESVLDSTTAAIPGDTKGDTSFSEIPTGSELSSQKVEEVIIEPIQASDVNLNVPVEVTTEAHILLADETVTPPPVEIEVPVPVEMASEANTILQSVTPMPMELDIPVTVEVAMEATTPPPSAVSSEPVTESVSVDTKPTHPNRILSGGLGNLLAHSHHHHHHHHHHHGNHDHHSHLPHQHHHNENVPQYEQVKDNSHAIGVQTIDETHLHFPDPVGVDGQQKSGDGLFFDPAVANGGLQSDTGEHTTNVPFTENPLDENALTGFCNAEGANCPQVTGGGQHANGAHEEVLPQSPIIEAPGLEKDIQVPIPAPQASSECVHAGEPFGDYVEVFLREALKMSDFILLLAITSFTLLVFSLGHYMINKNRREKPLIYKLNMIERDLMTAHKENGLLKAELHDTRHKLTSIENNSFGSNDMVIALKEELEQAEVVKQELQAQIAGLEKELENAAEAGLELNKMVAELLNQNGSDTIATSVDELQRQLNEQQQTILSMNASLAEKSRENSELQIAITNQTSRANERLEELQQARTQLTNDCLKLTEEVDRLKSELQVKVEGIRNESTAEIEKLTKDLKVAQNKGEEHRKALAVSEAKCEALEQCLKDAKFAGDGTGGNVAGLMDTVELNAKIALLTKDNKSLQDKLQGEIIARQLVEDHIKMVNEEISSLKRDYGKAEKDKLEAETRLEVLSSYFKEKETQLQKELSVKEAMWMQQQGETTTTVEKIRHLQDETQQLKSQNDKLRAEIEAQAAAHKAQYTMLETRSHDAWLTARQAERRLEESRNESSALRRKLTALGDVSAGSDGVINLPNMSTDLGMTAPSPMRVESPNAPPPLMGVLPPPPFMAPFMPGPPPPFLPPFMPPHHGPGEMRPPPLGRLMSPPPNRYSPNSIIDARDRYSPDRGRYSPDSRYDYSVMSTYETENDFSPPPSPPHHSRHSNYEPDRERERDRDRDRNFKERDRDRDRASDRDRDGRYSGNGGYARGYTPTGIRTSPPIQDPRNKKYAGGFSSGSQDSLGTRKSSSKYREGRNPLV
ncbi:transport and Golgi organization protein 1-like isoform X1 [Anopheles albimanus]|uniref:transport and Golgi organization protein 1-like isoform X1 n=1 Tax=Anopheles albimanus TaxID=7167 RepID=UPI00163EAD06|nr:transport and Golgi organization protein 1-like isoform X1 [Anopheles albimanus]